MIIKIKTEKKGLAQKRTVADFSVTMGNPDTIVIDVDGTRQIMGETIPLYVNLGISPPVDLVKEYASLRVERDMLRGRVAELETKLGYIDRDMPTIERLIEENERLRMTENIRRRDEWTARLPDSTWGQVIDGLKARITSLTASNERLQLSLKREWERYQELLDRYNELRYS